MSGTLLNTKPEVHSLLQPKIRERRFWPIFATIVVAAIIAAGTVWSFEHPFPVHWDEALDINEAQIDTQRLQHGMLVKLAGRLFVKCWGKPPAYRFVALPFLAVFGFHTTLARLTSLACLAFSAVFLYLATRKITQSSASAFAVPIFALSPVVVSASIWFSTEGPLYLATAAMFYYLFSSWTDSSSKSGSWIGLGLAIGLGLLSKASFIAIMCPAIAFAFLLGFTGRIGAQSFTQLKKAILLAAVIATPWWIVNIKPAINVAQQARGFVENSLGPPSIATWARYVSTFFQSLLGYGVGILIVLVLLAWLYSTLSNKGAVLDKWQKNALGVCACAVIPIVAVQLSGTNHLLRHVSPVMIPLAVAIGILAGNSGWERSAPAIGLSVVLLSFQLETIVSPIFIPNQQPLNAAFANAPRPSQIMARREQWDWNPLFQISRACGVDAPKIGTLGMGTSFSPPQIERPWAAAAASTGNPAFPYPNVRLLWRPEQGPIDWQKVMSSAPENDFVVTAPQYAGESPESNMHNAEFAERLSSAPDFAPPSKLEMGRFQPIDVLVFAKKSLSCHLAPVAARP